MRPARSVKIYVPLAIKNKTLFAGKYPAIQFQHPSAILEYATAEFESRWSKRIESVRKDVECTFRVWKKRFRILKVPFPYFAKENVDNIMFTCCVLHNILLDHDAREWTGQDDLDEFNVPTSSRDSCASYNPTDFSCMSGSDNNIPADECEAETTWLSLRSYLITHYKYAKCHNLLQWISYKNQTL